MISNVLIESNSKKFPTVSKNPSKLRPLSKENKLLEKSESPEQKIIAPIIKISTKSVSKNDHKRCQTVIVSQNSRNSSKQELRKPRVSTFPNSLGISDFKKFKSKQVLMHSKSPVFRRASILQGPVSIEGKKYLFFTSSILSLGQALQNL